jgi:hypothetical protein
LRSKRAEDHKIKELEMLRQPFFESLAILGIALGFIVGTVWFTPFNALAGLVLVTACSVMLYRHYAKFGTDTDALDDTSLHPY